MKRKELMEYTKERITKPVKLSKVVLNKVWRNLAEKNNGIVYRKTCYCFRCRKVVSVVYGDESAIKVKARNNIKVICKECLKPINAKKVGANFSKGAIYNNYFDVFDYDVKNDILIRDIYNLQLVYSIMDGELCLNSAVYKVGCDTIDLTTFKEEHYSRNLFGPYGTLVFRKLDKDNVFRKVNSIYRYRFFENCDYFVHFDYSFSSTNKVNKNFLQYGILSLLKERSNGDYNIIYLIAMFKISWLETLFKKINEVPYVFIKSLFIFLKTKKNMSLFEKLSYGIFEKFYCADIALTDIRINIMLALGNTYKMLDFKRKIYDIEQVYLKVGKYFSKDLFLYLQDKNCSYYLDYIDILNKLKMDLSAKRILMPKDLVYAHDYYSDLFLKEKEKIIANKNKEKDEALKKLQRQYELLNFSCNGYKFYLPDNVFSFVKRSNELKQCLSSAGYDKRVVECRSIIVFIDSEDSNSSKFKFTAELNRNLKIVQIHGFANDINATPEQLDNLKIVKSILLDRLAILSFKNGKIKYKNGFRTDYKSNVNSLGRS